MEATLDSVMAKEKEEDEKYEHLKKYEEKSKVSDNLVTNIDLTHMEGYAQVVKKVLKVKKGKVEDIRQTDLELLKKTEYQEKLRDGLADFYRDKAKEYIDRMRGTKGEWNLDEFDESLLTDMVYGTTRAHLGAIIAEEQDNFTPRRFMEKHKNDFMKRIRINLKSTAGQHLKDEHIEDIIKYTGIDKYDVDPTRVELPEAIGYLEMYVQNKGIVPPKAIDEKHKKPKKKGDKEEEKK